MDAKFEDGSNMTLSIARLRELGATQLRALATHLGLRLRQRRQELATAAILTAAYVLFGALDWGPALMGLAALGIWAWLWPPAGAVETSEGTALAVGVAPPAAPLHDEAVWRAMLDGWPDAALVLDKKANVIAANARAREQVTAVTNRHITQVSRAPELLAAIERALATDEPQSCQTRMLVPVERVMLGLVAPIAPAGAADGRPALLVVLRDQTEQDQLARMRADFVANASHELRTPLAALKGFIETLQGSARNDVEARDRFLEIMLEQAGRMSRLIEDLLSLSRVEMNEHIPPRSVIDVREMVGTAIGGLAPLAHAAAITLPAIAALEPSGPSALVFGDRDELLQVAQNLIQNAIKYGVRGGRVDIAIKPDGNRISFSVSDNGIGIAPEHLPRLTERFYRVSAKDSRERGGTGLGLAIVKHIVNHHRGELRVTSKPGEGSCFTVLLPRAPEPATIFSAPGLAK